MKKYMIILSGLLICVSSIECRTKKMNKASEFLKGTIALTAAASLGYLAYKAPIGKIQEQWTKLKDSDISRNTVCKIDDWCCNNYESLWNRLGTSIPGKSINKTKIFSFAVIIPAYELFKYGIVKLGNSFKSYKKVAPSDKS